MRKPTLQSDVLSEFYYIFVISRDYDLVLESKYLIRLFMEVCIAILHDSQYNDLWGSVKQLLEEKVFPTYFLTILLIVSRCKWNCTVCSSCDNLLVRVDMKLVPILSTFEVYTNSVKK